MARQDFPTMITAVWRGRGLPTLPLRCTAILVRPVVGRRPLGEVPADECLTDVARASISPRLSPDSPRRPHPDSRERPSSDSPDHTAVRSVGERTTVVRTSYDESGAEYVASPTGSGYLPSDLGVAETVSLDGSRDAIREINGYPPPPPPRSAPRRPRTRGVAPPPCGGPLCDISSRWFIEAAWSITRCFGVPGRRRAHFASVLTSLMCGEEKIGWRGGGPIFQPPHHHHGLPICLLTFGGGGLLGRPWGRGRGSVDTPTYIPQNDPCDSVIILNTHKWG